MNKANMKRAGLGFSALVLALSAVMLPINVAPAQAEGVSQCGSRVADKTINIKGYKDENGTNVADLCVFDSEFSTIEFTGTIEQFHYMMFTLTMGAGYNYRTYETEGGATINAHITTAISDTNIRDVAKGIAASAASAKLDNLTPKTKVVMYPTSDYVVQSMEALPEGYSVNIDGIVAHLPEGTTAKTALDYLKANGSKTGLISVNGATGYPQVKYEESVGAYVVYAVGANYQEALATFNSLDDHEALVATGAFNVSWDNTSRQIAAIHVDSSMSIADAYTIAKDTSSARAFAVAPAGTLKYWIRVEEKEGNKEIKVYVLNGDYLADALALDIDTIYIQKNITVEGLIIPAGKTVISDDSEVAIEDGAKSSILGTFIDKDGASKHLAKAIQSLHGSLVLSQDEKMSLGDSVLLLPQGATVYVEAEADDGYELDAVKVNGEVIEGNSFLSLSNDMTVTAEFAEQIRKTAVASIAPGQSLSFEAPENSTLSSRDGDGNYGFFYTEEGKESTLYKGDGIALKYSGGTWTIATSDDLPEGSYEGLFYSPAEHHYTFVTFEVTSDEDKATTHEAEATLGLISDAYEEALAAATTDEERKAAFDDFASNFDSAVTAQAILDAATSGDTVDVELEKKALDAADVDADVLEALADKLEEEGLGDYAENMTYYDLSFVVSVNDNEVGKLVQLDNAVQITLAVETAPDGYTRKYVVVRYHDGEDPVVLDSVYDEESGTVTFVSDKFSTYALAYLDAAQAKTPDTGVHTGAGNSAATVSAAVLATLVGLAVSAFSFKKLVLKK